MDTCLQSFFRVSLLTAAILWLINFLYINSCPPVTCYQLQSPGDDRRGDQLLRRLAQLRSESQQTQGVPSDQIVNLDTLLAVHYFCSAKYTQANDKLNQCIHSRCVQQDTCKWAQIKNLQAALIAQAGLLDLGQAGSLDKAQVLYQQVIQNDACCKNASYRSSVLSALNNLAICYYLSGCQQSERLKRIEHRKLARQTILQALGKFWPYSRQAKFLAQVLDSNYRVITYR
jgi:hypothetical protein